MTGSPLAAPPAQPTRLVYLGTPVAAVPPFEALVAAGHDVALVVTQPDRRRGRGARTSPSPVKERAVGLGIPVTHTVEDALEVGADLGVVVAFGRIIRRSVLEVLPMVNLHFSLLPRWRGAAPVERAILAGDAETGVAVMGVAEELDEGPIYAEEVTPIGAHETADELRGRLVAIGSRLLVATLAAGLGEPRPQVGAPTYAAKIGPEDLELRWELPAAELDRRVRIGGAWSTWRGERCKVWRSTVVEAPPGAAPGELRGTTVATGAGGLELVEVQPAGRARQAVGDWVRGTRPDDGERFGA